jgi:hypothetical protein
MPRKIPNQDRPLPIEQARGKVAKAMSDLMAGHDPGVISFRLKPTTTANETYPLKLSQPQRESVIHCTRLKSKIKERLEETGEGTQTVGVTRKELDHLHDEIGTAAFYAPSPHKARLLAVMREVVELLAADQVGLFGEGLPTPRRSAPKKGDLIYQFKVTLLGIRPAIWRRIQVPDCTLADLHEYLQAALGWWNSHLHKFEINGERYGPAAPDDLDFGMEMRDEDGVTLGNLIPKSGRSSRWIYEYDFGDGWRHELLFEGFPNPCLQAKEPLCVEGERACPPEDCGGSRGYGEYLAAIHDPKHEQHEELLGWRGPFDSESFNAKKATKAMRQVK